MYREVALWEVTRREVHDGSELTTTAFIFHQSSTLTEGQARRMQLRRTPIAAGALALSSGRQTKGRRESFLLVTDISTCTARGSGTIQL